MLAMLKFRLRTFPRATTYMPATAFGSKQSTPTTLQIFGNKINSLLTKQSQSERANCMAIRNYCLLASQNYNLP